MFTCVVACLGLVASAPDSSAEALIRQALECEAKGQSGERQRLLELAVQADPASPTARGLLGQVKVDGQWLSPEQAAGREQSDAQRRRLPPSTSRDELPSPTRPPRTGSSLSGASSMG